MTRDVTIQLSANLEQYKEELNSLFQTESITESFRQNLNGLNDYYTRRFWKNDNDTKRKSLVNEYGLLLETIKKIKTGSLKTEQALKNISDISSDRKIDVIIQNIFKTCELLFWLTAAITSYAFCIGFGIPIMFFNPVVGLAITIGTSVLMLEAAIQTLKCVDEFKSFDPINKQEKLERNLISFFLPPKASQDTSVEKEEDELEDSMNYNSAYC